MPSATVLYSLPVPLGRRGTAAAAVIGLHVLLVVALLSGITRVPVPGTPEEPIVAIPLPAPPPLPTRAPSVERPAPLSGLIQDTFVPPTVVGPRTSVEPLWTTPVVPSDPAPAPRDPAPSALPRVLESTEPLYPSAARRMGHEGSVQLRVRVDALGRAEAVEVAKSSGYSLLDAAAMNAVRRWRFAPAQAEGRAIAAWVTFTVTFRLTDR